MTPEAAAAFALALALLLLLALHRPTRRRVSGLVYQDKQGRWVLVLSPATKGKGRR